MALCVIIERPMYRWIKQFLFLFVSMQSKKFKVAIAGTTLDDHKCLNDYQIKVNTTKAAFTGNTLEPIKAVLGIEVNVHTAKLSVVNMKFDKLDRENFTCHDIMTRLEKQGGVLLTYSRK